ncbi:MAG: hypothetical protein C4293_20470 [Nitrospiraceae bacterium]
MILVPNPERKHSDRAWNRIEDSLKERLSRLERNGHSGTKVSCIFLQAWEEEKLTILIPFRDLLRLKTFRDSGDFTVRREGLQFFLITPTWEENIKLKSRLEDIFSLL